MNLSFLDDGDTAKKERRAMMSTIPDLVQSDSDCLNDNEKYETKRIDDDSDDDDDDTSDSDSDDKSSKEESQSSRSSSNSKNLLHQSQEEECDACPCCEDVCGSNCCQLCTPSSSRRMMNDDLTTSGVTTSFHRNTANDQGGASPNNMLPAPWRQNDRRIGPSSEPSSSPLSLSSSPGSNNLRYFTMCEIRRHNTHRSIWLVAGKKVYDVTDYMKYHPGGQKCFLSKAGGARDVTRDLNFHSKRGQKLWQKFHIGYVKECPSVLQSSATSLPFQNGDSNDVSRGIAAAGVTSNTSPRTWCFLPKFWEMR